MSKATPPVMNPASATDRCRVVQLPGLDQAPGLEATLRQALRQALQQALTPGLLLGLAACGRQPLDPAGPIGTGAMAGMDVGGEGGMAGGAVVGGGAGGDAVGGAGGSGNTFGMPGWPSDAGCAPVPTALDELRPANPADYVALMSGFQGTVQDETGVPCQSASDVEACKATFARAAARDNGCHEGGCAPFVLVTRGDQVLSITSQKQLLLFLGSIDSRTEAALVFRFGRYTVSCVKPLADGFEVEANRRISDCPVEHARFLLHIKNDGTIVELRKQGLGDDGACIGRRPAGLQALAATVPSGALAAFLAGCAALEAASVPAFVILARDLRVLEAPADLIQQALAAADDEVRHARLVGALALQHGGVVKTPAVVPTAAKSLLALAAENVVEGCVRETFGALVAQYQAARAHEPDIAATMSAIAEDELRHAALGWQIAAWAHPRLSGHERALVMQQQRKAVARLRDELAAGVDAAIHALAGWPCPEAALALWHALERELWAPQAGASQA